MPTKKKTKALAKKAIAPVKKAAKKRVAAKKKAAKKSGKFPAKGHEAKVDVKMALQQKFLEVFPDKLFNIAATCKAIGIHRGTYYDWINQDQTFLVAMQEMKERVIDHVESMLLKNCGKGMSADIKYFLSTQAKHRGYGEALHIDHGSELLEKMQRDELSSDQLDAIIIEERLRLERAIEHTDKKD